MITFRSIRKFIAPRWLTEGEGEPVGYSLDLVKDAFAERARLGLLIRFPEQDAAGTPAPDDALAAMGRDRRVARGINETVERYVERLLNWIDDRKAAGNAFSLMKQLSAILGPGPSFRTVDARGNWYSHDVSGVESYTLNTGNWNWESGASSDRWARFWVIIYPNGLWSAESVWGASTWGDGGAWGTTETLSEVSTVKGLVSEWKPAGTLCVNIILALDPTSFDPTTPEPDGFWANYSKLSAGTQVRSRLDTARYEAGK